MTDKRPNPSPRIYLATRHREWWHALPRFERSKVVNEALDLYRREHSGADPDAPTRTAPPTPHQDAE